MLTTNSLKIHIWEGEEMARSENSLLCENEVLRVSPQHPCTQPSVMAHSCYPNSRRERHVEPVGF